MTYCGTLGQSIDNRVKDGMTLDEISKEICTTVKNPRQKVVRIIKELLGEQYLIDNAKSLEYNVGKADFGKMPKAPKLRKIEATVATDSEESTNQIVSQLRKIEAGTDSDHKIPSSETDPKISEVSKEKTKRIIKFVYENGVDEVQNVINEIKKVENKTEKVPDEPEDL